MVTTVIGELLLRKILSKIVFLDEFPSKDNCSRALRDDGGSVDQNSDTESFDCDPNKRFADRNF